MKDFSYKKDISNKKKKCHEKNEKNKKKKS
jgi:hypothetical protein